MSHDVTTIDHRWVAFGPAGAVGSVLRDEHGFTVRMMREDADRGPYPTLEIAKNALHAAMGPGADRPEFREH